MDNNNNKNRGIYKPWNNKKKEITNTRKLSDSQSNYDEWKKLDQKLVHTVWFPLYSSIPEIAN